MSWQTKYSVSKSQHCQMEDWLCNKDTISWETSIYFVVWRAMFESSSFHHFSKLNEKSRDNSAHFYPGQSNATLTVALRYGLTYFRRESITGILSI